MDHLFQIKTLAQKASSAAKTIGWINSALGLLLLLLLACVGTLPSTSRGSSSKPPRFLDEGLAHPRQPKIAIVIDDIGYVKSWAQRFIAMPPHITLAVIPFAPYATELARLGHSRGHQIIVHMPMEPIDRSKMPPEVLRTDMSIPEMNKEIKRALNLVPYAVGMNNHMGSRFTTNPQAIQRWLQTMRGLSFFVLDSKTYGGTSISEQAKALGIPSLERTLFLDQERKTEAIEHQLGRLPGLAKKRGCAIAIGHPYPETALALAKFIEKNNKNKWLDIVPLSRILYN